ncbi:hypothetical protein CW748_07440 [Alteromonadales bacterium alter-6D02]|nr:hypothetical protein CW748_07440 [Alteromonadales bacterium alter-6D02]
MALSGKELAIKYHSLEDEEWVENGTNAISLICSSYCFNDRTFETKRDLLSFIKTFKAINVLIIYDSSTEPSLMAKVFKQCELSHASKISIKCVDTYGR